MESKYFNKPALGYLLVATLILNVALILWFSYAVAFIPSSQGVVIARFPFGLAIAFLTGILIKKQFLPKEK